jgi:hypothetical protein
MHDVWDIPLNPRGFADRTIRSNPYGNSNRFWWAITGDYGRCRNGKAPADSSSSRFYLIEL